MIIIIHTNFNILFTFIVNHHANITINAIIHRYRQYIWQQQKKLNHTCINLYFTNHQAPHIYFFPHSTIPFHVPLSNFPSTPPLSSPFQTPNIPQPISRIIQGPILPIKNTFLKLHPHPSDPTPPPQIPPFKRSFPNFRQFPPSRSILHTGSPSKRR